MPEHSGKRPERAGLRRGVNPAAVAALLFGTLGISTACGMVLLLPLRVQELGGDEASFGVILSSATIPAVLCISFLLRFPEALRPNMVVALAIAVYALGTGGAAFVTGSWTPIIGAGVLLGGIGDNLAETSSPVKMWFAALDLSGFRNRMPSETVDGGFSKSAADQRHFQNQFEKT